MRLAVWLDVSYVIWWFAEITKYEKRIRQRDRVRKSWISVLFLMVRLAETLTNAVVVLKFLQTMSTKEKEGQSVRRNENGCTVQSQRD